jgi:hypothetical protein
MTYAEDKAANDAYLRKERLRRTPSFLNAVYIFNVLGTDPPDEDHYDLTDEDWAAYDQAVANVAKARAAL